NDTIGSISSDGANLYAFYQSYVAVDSYNVVYKKFNGSTWDSSSTAITSDNANNFHIGSVAKRAGASYIPLLWNTGTALPYTVKGHAVSTVVTGSAPAAPTLLFPPTSGTGVVHRPHFELRATDADGDYLKYKIEVCSASDCSVVVRTIDQTSSQTGWAGQDQQTGTAYTGSTTLSSSTIAQHNYQNPPLAVSTQYWWRAYAIDPGGGNTFSSPSSIFTFTTAAAIPIQFQPNTTIRGGTKIN
ncbi:MAG TPA: hypothetical protein VFK94_05435, partial [Patescibacteria group bacterium]|nr:hypothetical protein [Patescibacteria group bacterium]